jgi:flagellar biosynthesis chaperone FliJ
MSCWSLCQWEEEIQNPEKKIIENSFLKHEYKNQCWRRMKSMIQVCRDSDKCSFLMKFLSNIDISSHQVSNWEAWDIFFLCFPLNFRGAIRRM